MEQTSKISTFISTLKYKYMGKSDTFDTNQDIEKLTQITPKNENSGVEINNVDNITQQQILDKLSKENNNLKSIIKHKNHYIKQLKNTIEELEKSIDNSLNNSPNNNAENKKISGHEKVVKTA